MGTEAGLKNVWAKGHSINALIKRRYKAKLKEILRDFLR